MRFSFVFPNDYSLLSLGATPSLVIMVSCEFSTVFPPTYIHISLRTINLSTNQLVSSYIRRNCVVRRMKWGGGIIVVAMEVGN